ncbi:MAG: hypothetical protein LIP16_21435 [Clostridium sp.]|nr:hypothetical protein [Clostridium sp.]
MLIVIFILRLFWRKVKQGG